MFNYHYTRENCHLGFCMNETYGDIYLIFSYENYEDNMWSDPKSLLITNANIHTTKNTKTEIMMHFMSCIDNYRFEDGEKYPEDVIEMLKEVIVDYFNRLKFNDEIKE